MRSAVRLCLVSTIAVVMLTATASASAHHFSIEGAEVTSSHNLKPGSFTGNYVFLGKPFLVAVHVECTKVHAAGSIGAAGTGSAAFEFSSCAVTKPANCTVKQPIVTEVNMTLIGPEPGTEIEFMPKGTAFTTITLEGASCVLKEPFAVTGSQTCALPGGEAEAIQHEIACATTGSKLKAGGAAATFEGSIKGLEVEGEENWSVAGGLPAPRVEWVDFTGNEEVLVDHQKEAVEAPIDIEEVPGGGADKVEWKSPKAGEFTKNWPIAYVQGKKIEINEVRFGLPVATREFLEKKLEGEPEITGTTTIGGTAVTFKKKLTGAEVAAQLTAHKEYLEISVEAALPAKVLYELVTITWKWEVKEKGPPVRTYVQQLGKSKHNLYLLAKAPIAGTTIYLTLLDLATRGVAKEAQPPGEKETIAGVWRGFSNVEAGLPSVHARYYKPKTETGSLEPNGKILEYYGEVIKSGETFERVYEEEITNKKRNLTCPNKPLPTLLEEFKGRCGMWAEVFQTTLATEGVASSEVVLYVKFGAGACAVVEKCEMLVKKWGFGVKGAGEFPYSIKETIDEEGVAAQGVKNPPPFFWDHVIVKAGPAGAALLYDPSYGAGPFSGEKVAKPATEKSVLEEYQSESIAGFCDPPPFTGCTTTAEVGLGLVPENEIKFP